MSDYVSKIIEEISGGVDGYLRQVRGIEHTGPSLRMRGANSALSYNLFPSEGEVEETWLSLLKVLGVVFKEVGRGGEIIEYSGEGSIVDGGEKAFVVERAHLWECYIYEPEVFIYCRLLNEKDPYQTQKEWFSVDVDVVDRSAWFAEVATKSTNG